MFYEIVIHKQAKKKLSSLPLKQKIPIAEAIKALGLDPDDATLDIKKLVGRVGFRMRVGSWRIIFERHDCFRIISIEKIGARGDVYK
ncbi:MAG: hypothetical protein RLZ35_485 [Pseudomonadota bacterium]|jgi:mRNA interferase RelE/StbE